MNNATIISHHLNNPLIKAIAYDFVPYFKLQVIQHALGVSYNHFKVKSTKKSGFGQAFQKWIKTYNMKKRQTILPRIVQGLSDKEVISTMIKNKIDLTSSKSVLKALDKNPFLIAQLKKSVNSLEALHQEILARVGPPPSNAPSWVNKQLKITLSEVHMIDETNSERGEDDIGMSIICTNETGMDAIKTNITVGEFDEDGTKKRAPYRHLVTFPLNDNYYTEKVFTVTSLMAELDSGGFFGVVNYIHAMIKDEAPGAVQAAILASAAEVGANIDAHIGNSQRVFAMLCDSIIGWIASVLIKWMAILVYDDVFPPIVFAIGLPATDSTFNGSLVTEVGVDHIGHDGHYISWYKIELVR